MQRTPSPETLGSGEPTVYPLKVMQATDFAHSQVCSRAQDGFAHAASE